MTYRITIRVRQPRVAIAAGPNRVGLRLAPASILPQVIDCGQF